MLKIAFGGSYCSQKLLELDRVNIDAHNGSVRDLVLSRYRPRHNVEITDYTVWKVDRNRFRLIQDSNYNALEHELDKDSGTFKKAIYYIHHYTIRYYVRFLRWYIGKAEELVARAKGKWGESTTRWVSCTVLYVIPYLFHVLLIVAFVKLTGRRTRLFSALFLALLLTGVSTILFYFGMSPWSLFVICVGVPLGIYFAPSIWDSISSDMSNYSGSAPSYTCGGGTSSCNGEEKVTTIYTDEDGTEYEGEGKNPETIEKQTPGDHAIFDKCIDGSYKERYGDRVVKKGLGVD